MKYGSVSAPAGGAFAITPDNAGVLRATALYVGGVGDLRVLTEDGDDVVFKAVPAGSFVPVRVSRVYATNTTATSIVGLRP